MTISKENRIEAISHIFMVVVMEDRPALFTINGNIITLHDSKKAVLGKDTDAVQTAIGDVAIDIHGDGSLTMFGQRWYTLKGYVTM